MIHPSTIDTIINILSADRAATPQQVEAARRFFAAGCISDVPTFVVHGGLLPKKSEAARLLGMSRTQFSKEAKKIMPDGLPQFIERFVAGEKFCRYEKISLIAYANTDRATLAAAVNPKLQVA